MSLLPPTLNHSTRTFAGLRKTLDSLDPLVAASKPASRRLAPFATQLDELTRASIPTIGALNDLIRNPSGSGDLITLLDEMPSLASVAHRAFPVLIKEMNDSQAQLDYLREFTPDVVAALTNIGQAGAYYDANGHYQRTQPVFGAFGLDASNQLTEKPPSDRYLGFQEVHSRCPGGAVQPPPDGSAPVKVPNCSPSTTSRRVHEAARTDPRRLRWWRSPRGRRSGSSRGAGLAAYDVRAIFDDAAFAVPGEDVRIAGANVGTIQSLDVTTAGTEQAAVTIEIDNPRFTPFYANATCSIRPQSLIGENYVDCNPGNSRTPELPKIRRGPGRAVTTCCR